MWRGLSPGCQELSPRIGIDQQFGRATFATSRYSNSGISTPYALGVQCEMRSTSKADEDVAITRIVALCDGRGIERFLVSVRVHVVRNMMTVEDSGH